MSELVEAPQAEQTVAQVPFLCPHCGKSGDPINMTSLGSLLVFWHVSCKKILNVQLISIPQQAQGRIVVPGRSSLQ